MVAGQAVEGQEGLDAVGDDLLEAPGVVGAGDGGDLDRDVVDVLAGDQAGDLSQAAGGLLLPQDGLAQEVDVEAVAALAQAGEGGPESLVGGVDDEVADDLPEDSPGDRGDGARGEAGGGRAQPHGPGQGGRQEVCAPCRQALEGGAGDVEVGGTHDVVDEAGGECQALGVGEDAGQELGRARYRLGCRLVSPPACSGDGFLAQRPQVVGAAAFCVTCVGAGLTGNGGVRHACGLQVDMT